jgi:phage baseplate assembly protein W
MAGVDRHTFQVTDNLTSALQSAETILTTRIGSRVMRRHFGGGVVEVLGRRLVIRTFALLEQLIGTALDAYEPRLLVRQVSFKGATSDLRLGNASFVIRADYRPFALKGDFRVDRTVDFSLGVSQGQVQASVIDG